MNVQRGNDFESSLLASLVPPTDLFPSLFLSPLARNRHFLPPSYQEGCVSEQRGLAACLRVYEIADRVAECKFEMIKIQIQDMRARTNPPKLRAMRKIWGVLYLLTYLSTITYTYRVTLKRATSELHSCLPASRLSPTHSKPRQVRLRVSSP